MTVVNTSSHAVEASDAAVEVRSLYESDKTIYARSVSGWFAGWRWALVWGTQLLFYGLPWLEWNARQAVLFDLGSRRFYIFDLVLYPQDFIYLTGMLILSAYALFLVTAVAGRVWCGFACPQTVYTEIYMWVERQFEGDRIARMRLDAAPWTATKWLRKGGPLPRVFRVFHAHPKSRNRGVNAGFRTLGMVLGSVLRLCDLRQCWLHARTGL